MGEFSRILEMKMWVLRCFVWIASWIVATCQVRREASEARSLRRDLTGSDQHLVGTCCFENRYAFGLCVNDLQ